MSANNEARALGLGGLVEVSEIIERKHRNTLHSWYNNNPDLFKIVLLGCVKFKELKERGEIGDVFLDTTASKQAKYAGLKDMGELCSIVKKQKSTINGWHEQYPSLFKVVVLGCVEFLKKQPCIYCKGTGFKSSQA